jgi:tetratricopeptide (TPR) repeat protein
MNRRYIGAVLLLALFLCACVAAGKKQYDVGMQLSSQGKYKEAIAYLNQAIEKEPSNKQYQKALSDMKEKLVSDFISKGNQALTAQSPATMGAINKAKAELAGAKEIDPANPAVMDFESRIGQQEKAFLSQVKNLYSSAKKQIQERRWLEASFNLQQVQTLFPNYEDSFYLLNQVSNEGAQELFVKAKKRFEQEDFKGAVGDLRQALSLKGDHAPSRELLNLAEQRNTKGYFIEQAKEATYSQNWDRAAYAYERALEYDPDNQDLRQLIVHVRNRAGEFNIRKAKDLMEEGWLLKAYEAFETGTKHMKDPNDYRTSSLRRDLTSRAKFTALQFQERGQYGTAWFWYNKIRGIDPEYPDIFYLTQEMEDNVKQRVQKSIAVFDFSSPVNSTDAGVIVANNLITFLFNNASGDIKILERENLKSILEEMKLGQIGVVSSQSAQEMGRVYGIDVAIMGSVLLFKVDTSVSDGTKSVKYEIGKKIEDNIEYLNWKAKHPNPSPKDLAEAPPAKVQIPQYTEKDYKVSNHKKVGFVQLSFRIVDVRTGENIQVRTIERKETKEDDTSAGLPEAGVKFDPLEIATNTELLQNMTADVVSELGREALRPLQNLEQKYFQTGENFLRRKNEMQAAESFVDAIFDEKLKRIQGSPLADKAMENLMEIFREYRVTLEG